MDEFRSRDDPCWFLTGNWRGSYSINIGTTSSMRELMMLGERQAKAHAVYRFDGVDPSRLPQFRT